MKCLFVVGLSFLMAGLSGICTGTDLARGGKTEYTIVQGANATDAEKFAARELRDFLEKVTGTKFAAMLETNKTLPSKAIYVGWTDFARRNIDPSKLGQEDWIIKTEGDNLILTGGRPRGTLYAVYEYLEQELGCRWLDEFTEIVPSKPELKLEPMDIKGRPLLWGRTIYTASAAIFDQELCDLFDVRNKDTKSPSARYGFGGILYGSPNACHTFYEYSKDWPADHPEYLAMNDKGERVKSTNGIGPGQICLTNPEVRKLMLEKLRKYIVADRERAVKEGYPPPRIYSVEPNDNPLSCRCPECKAFSEREGSDSGPLVDMVNYLADGVRTEYPDVLIDTFAYMQTLIPPKTVKPRDNVIIRLAQLNAEWIGGMDDPQYPDYFRPIKSPLNSPSCETLLKWSKIAKHMSIWDYWIMYDLNGADRFETPYANTSCISADMKLFFNSHAETIFVECEKPEISSFFALKRWLGLKLMQNPEQSSDALVKTFMSGYYGSASGKMSEYLAYMEKRINAVPENVKLSQMLEQKRPYLDLDFFVTSIKLLDEAEAMCGADKQALLHVQRERLPVDTGLLGMWKYLQKNLTAGEKMPFARDAVIKNYETVCLGQMEAFYANEKQADGKKKLEEQLGKYKKMPSIGKLQSEKPPQLKVAKLKENMDGDLSKVDWSQVTLIEKWKELSTGGELPERKVTGRLAHDDRFLYVQLAEETDTSKLKPEISVGDNWELFFAAERDKAPYNQLAINLKGEHTDYTWQKTPADGGKPDTWENAAVVKSEADGKVWKVSLAFPLAKIVPGGIKPGQKLYAHFYRSTPLPGKHLAWSPTFEMTFHLQSRMGMIAISGTAFDEDDVNLLKNSELKLDSTGQLPDWGTWLKCKFTQDVGYKGQNSVRMTLESGNDITSPSRIVLYQAVDNLKPGKYILSANIKLDREIQTLSALTTKVVKGETVYDGKALSAEPGEWTNVTAEFDIPEGITSAAFAFSFLDATAGATVWVDSPVLYYKAK